MKKCANGICRILSGNEKGFTLIELLVVVAILGVLAAVVALNVGSFIGEGHDEAACAELHNVQTAVLAWMAANTGQGTPTLAQTEAYLVGTPSGTYSIGTGGLVTQNDFEGGAACSRQQ